MANFHSLKKKIEEKNHVQIEPKGSFAGKKKHKSHHILRKNKKLEVVPYLNLEFLACRQN
jgi:hypothetical protein